MTPKNRVIGLEQIRAADLIDNAQNWRVHPHIQMGAMNALLKEVGIAGALTAYRSARNGGRLTLIDGHGRKSEHPDEMWPVLVLDVDDAEADKLLASLDPITGLAETASDTLRTLVENIETDSLELRDLWWQEIANGQETDEGGGGGGGSGAPDMEIQPFEQYDYVLLMFKKSADFQTATQALGLQSRAYPLPDKTKGKPKSGLCRVVDGPAVIARLRPASEVAPASDEPESHEDILARLES